MLVLLLMLLLLLCSVFSPSFAILNFACTLLRRRTQLLEELQQFYATHCKSMLVTTCLGTATFILRHSVIMAMNFFALVVVIFPRYLPGTYARKDAFLWLVSTLKFHYSWQYCTDFFAQCQLHIANVQLSSPVKQQTT